jgi:hypothetical protein
LPGIVKKTDEIRPTAEGTPFQVETSRKTFPRVNHLGRRAGYRLASNIGDR